MQQLPPLRRAAQHGSGGDPTAPTHPLPPSVHHADVTGLAHATPRYRRDRRARRWHYPPKGKPPGGEAMPPLLDAPAVLRKLAALPVESYGAGDLVLAGGSSTGKLLIMSAGAVEVVRGGVRIAEITEPGAVFGDLAVLLDQPHSADVRALAPSSFYVADGRTILRVDPITTLYVAVVLAQRLDTVDSLLVEARRQLARAEEPRDLIRETLENIGRTVQYGPPL
jgi:CRP-like cAMP-binding protein